MASQLGTAALGSLKDLEGVVGSFLVGAQGTIVAQDLPAYFGSAAYDIGPRAQRLRQALSMAEGDVSMCVLSYGDHKVSFRPIGSGILSVISEREVNMPALRMATNLVSKKLGQALTEEARATSTPPPPTVRPPAEQSRSSQKRKHSRGAPEAQGSRPKKKRAVYFRGKRIE